ncbi:MAG: hypothetical protein HC780_09265 [Leptolyngbyaceae cyanobacterium CSU_1_3]|nr:hypothetical protein [Leptolyngbyaceae cyanobacterium CSU_1_3]
MSNRKLAKAIQGLFREVWRLYHTTSKKLINWFLRTALMTQRKMRASNAGFVLPTTVLLILVVTLTVGAMTFRAYNRNVQVIGQSQQRVIYNAATPAIDRARAKIEFLFDPSKDTRYPGGVPPETTLLGMMLNDGSNGVSRRTFRDPDTNQDIDPYQLPDEARVDLDGGGVDNAWSFRTDTDGNGQADATVIYSILFTSPTDDAGTNPNTLLLRLSDKDKADRLWIRQGPLSNETKSLGCNFNTSSKGSLRGWFDERSNTSILRKNFQVDAFVVPDNPNATAVTLEFQQDRQLNRGNKWGAWFRNDLEIHPGPAFNWNGAMHTEGSLILSNGGQANGGLTAHLISAPSSCLYTPDASEITVTDITPSEANQENRDYLGLVMAGRSSDNSRTGSARIYLPTTTPAQGVFRDLDSTTDGAIAAARPMSVSIDPKVILFEDGYTVRDTDGGNNRDQQNWARVEETFPQRIRRDPQVAPYVDDLYRADNRWGPKPRYDSTADNAMRRPTGDGG